MSDCVFCKIMSGEFSSMKMFEDEHTLAFMDIAKDVDGHILVAPKKHVENIMECDFQTLDAVMNTVKKVSNQLVDKCGYEGVNLLHASGESADQSVPHFHMHIIPRKAKDGIEAWPNFSGAKYPVEDTFKTLTENMTK